MPHLDDGRIQELLDGEVPSSELSALQSHLVGCQGCRARLTAARAMADEADALITALDEPIDEPVVVVPEPAPRRPAHWTRRLAWAASLVIAAGAGYLSRGTLPSPPPTAEADAEARGGASSVAAPPAVATATESPPDPVARSTPPPATPRSRDGEPGEGAMAGQPTATSPQPPPARSDEDSPVGLREERLVARDAGGRQAAEARDEIAAAPAQAAGNRLQRAAPILDSVAGFRPAPAPEPLRSFSDAAKAIVSIDTIDLPEAVALLGGSLRLIEGLVPAHLERASDEVRVVYHSSHGEIRLAQRRVDGTIVWRLLVSDRYPADSLAGLRARVRN